MKYKPFYGGCSSMAERYTVDVVVVGSSPITRPCSFSVVKVLLNLTAKGPPSQIPTFPRWDFSYFFP